MPNKIKRMRYTLRRRFERLATDRWARRSLRTLLRSAWVGLSFMCIGLGLQLLVGWSVSLEILSAFALCCVAVGAMRLLRPRMSPQEVAQRLDHRFGLQEQLITALEVSQRSSPQGVELRLLEQAHITTNQVQHHVARQRRYPWVEMMALLAMVFVVAGMVLLTTLMSSSGQPVAELLPQLVPPNDMQNQAAGEPPPEQSAPEQMGSQGTQAQAGIAQGQGFDQQSAESLAEALRDQSATRPAAEALDRGDAASAAQRLRELADQSGQLSPDTRRDLANELRSAAAEIEGRNPDLADQVRQSAYGMQQDGQSNAEAFENLADAVEQLDGTPQQAQQGDQGQQGSQGDQGMPGQPGGGAASNAPFSGQREMPQSSERLGVDGVPLELNSQGNGQTPSEGDPSTTAPGSGSFEPGEGAPGDSATIQIGDDPLRIPADLRDVVQEYFSPAP